ncbi:YhcH/YjgK/YiaL family protein [Mycoplasma corogypsi]|uniref:YhcH/YjgK/YiaL family protein n=1 Tax=Mycoplasma corogypsi TaxID=2106 RepID=UPI003872BF37
MIFDKLSNIKKYQFPEPQIAKALEIAAQTDFNSLEKGVHIIDENIKIVKKDFETKFEGYHGEIHDKHIDIHIFGSVEEKIYFKLEPKYTEVDILEQNEALDVVFVKTTPHKHSVILNEGYFALFFPGELHNPTINNHNINLITKNIIKVKIK